MSWDREAWKTYAPKELRTYEKAMAARYRERDLERARRQRREQQRRYRARNKERGGWVNGTQTVEKDA